MGTTELALACAALLIGATGAFSPCGFSVVETLGPTGHTGGRRTTIAACITFLPGAVAGGLLTFGLLALLGEALHGAGGQVAFGAAAAIAVAAALLELRGTRIVPQIRRQLPEHWRRVMPMPVAAALYGVLLGIGFTTFVLSFGVWALAGISLVIGDPAIGVLIGAGFGLGRAIPVVVLAPLAGSEAGARATDLMATRPGVYRGLRMGDGLALSAVAAVLVVNASGAGAAGTAASSAADPSATVDTVVFERIGGNGVLMRGGAAVPLPGTDPAIGGAYIVVRNDDLVTLLSRETLLPVAEVPAPSADSLAVSSGWLVYRARLQSGGDGIFARDIANPAAPGPIQTVSTIADPAQLSPPSIDAGTLVYGVAKPRGSRIVLRVLGNRKRRILVRSKRRGSLVFNPAIKGRSFAYVRDEGKRSRLVIRRLKRRGGGHRVFGVKRSRGTLWSTSLTDGAAYVTLLRPAAEGAGAEVVRVPLGGKKKRKKR